MGLSSGLVDLPWWGYVIAALALTRDERMLTPPVRARLTETLAKSRTLQTMYSMRRELAAL